MSVLILAGAGASKAVDKELYPTTVEFFDLLPETITENKMFSSVKQLLEYRKGETGIIDIEEILWALNEINKFVDDINDQNSIIGWLIQGSKLTKAVGKHENLSPLIIASQRARPILKELISQINKIRKICYNIFPFIFQFD